MVHVTTPQMINSLSAVTMMGFLGIGNNPMVGCTVTCVVDVAQALNK